MDGDRARPGRAAPFLSVSSPGGRAPQGARSCHGLACQKMTGCMVIVAGLVGRRCHEAAVEGLRAARPEDAALGQVDQTRNLARDGRKLPGALMDAPRSEEHTSELQSLMRISYAVFCLKKKK